MVLVPAFVAFVPSFLDPSFSQAAAAAAKSAFVFAPGPTRRRSTRSRARSSRIPTAPSQLPSPLIVLVSDNSSSSSSSSIDYASADDDASSSVQVTASCTPHTDNKGGRSKRKEGGVGLYVHIPYCRRRCRYCDFAIVPVGSAAAVAAADDNKFRDADGSNTTGSSRAADGFRAMDDAYRKAILAELDLIHQTTTSGENTSTSSSKTSTGKVPLRSIYFGGGTPSLAPASTLRSILAAIVDGSDNGPFYIPLCPAKHTTDDDDGGGGGIEITIEMDPGTFTEDKLCKLRDAGFNRISLGVQSFDDDILNCIGRVHRRADVLDSIDMIRRVFSSDGEEASSSINNHAFSYSVDLISGLPGLTLAKWAETLETAINLHPRPDHLSLYDLQVEEGTVFGKWYGDDEDAEDDSNAEGDALARTRSAPSIDIETGKGMPSLPSPEDCAYMYRYASGYLRARGYEHYEISSYARRGRRSKHNQIYWEIESTWYAIGLGATSCISGNRFARPRTMADYIDWVGQQKMIVDEGSGPPIWLVADDTSDGDDASDDFLTDVILTKLRTKEGLDMNWVRHDVADGEAKVEAILRGAELALDMDLAKHEVDSNGHDFLRLKDPDGFLFSNNIISQIFVELDELE